MQFIINIEDDQAKGLDLEKIKNDITDTITKGIATHRAQAEKEKGVKDGTITVNLDGKPRSPSERFKLPAADDAGTPVKQANAAFKLPKGE